MAGANMIATNRVNATIGLNLVALTVSPAVAFAQDGLPVDIAADPAAASVAHSEKLSHDAAFQLDPLFQGDPLFGVLEGGGDGSNPAIDVLLWLENVFLSVFDAIGRALTSSAEPADGCQSNVGLALDALWDGAYDTAKTKAISGAGDCATTVFTFVESLFF